jgi:phosphoglycerate dehydrogenase-like enzyme
MSTPAGSTWSGGLLTVCVPTEALAADLGGLPPGVALEVWHPGAPSRATDVDLLVLPYMREVEAMSELGELRPRLIQSQSIGYEGIAPLLPPGTRLANAAGVHEASTAELALALILVAQRGIADFVRAQDTRKWEPEFTPSLADRRVLLIGYGGVGKAIASRLAPFEVELTVVARRARREQGVTVHGIEELSELLPLAEIVTLTLPGGASTHRLMDAAALARMPDGTLLVNVGRGSLVDPDALAEELGRGRLRAAIDVVDPEPLPVHHRLWGCDGLILTPHVGGASNAMHPRIARLIRTQISRLLSGEAPANTVL